MDNMQISWLSYTTDIPSGKSVYYSGSAVNGKSIYIVGGPGLAKYIEEFDTVNKTFTRLAQVPTYKEETPLCYYYEGNLYIMGGSDSDNKSYKYNISTGEFTELTAIPYRFYNGGGVGVDNYIYIFGGLGSTGVTKAYRYDILTDSYEALATIPFSFGHGRCVYIDGSIYLFGSYVTDNFTKAYKYDVNSNTYTALPNIPTGVVGCGCATYNGKIFLLSGSETNSKAPVTTCYMFDPIDETYTPIDNIPTATIYSSTALVDNKIYVIGGQNNKQNIEVLEIKTPISESEPIVIETGDTTSKFFMPEVYGFKYGFLAERLYVSGGVNRYTAMYFLSNQKIGANCNGSNMTISNTIEGVPVEDYMYKASVTEYDGTTAFINRDSNMSATAASLNILWSNYDVQEVVDGKYTKVVLHRADVGGADPCFCHFNGYQVKDAVARASIEELTTALETTNANLSNLEMSSAEAINNLTTELNTSISEINSRYMVVTLNNIAINEYQGVDGLTYASVHGEVDYPAGLNSENCVIASYMYKTHFDDGTEAGWFSGISTPRNSLELQQSGYFSLGSDKIYAGVNCGKQGNVSGSIVTSVSFKVTLMKI